MSKVPTDMVTLAQIDIVAANSEVTAAKADVAAAEEKLAAADKQYAAAELSQVQERIVYARDIRRLALQNLSSAHNCLSSAQERLTIATSLYRKAAGVIIATGIP